MRIYLGNVDRAIYRKAKLAGAQVDYARRRLYFRDALPPDFEPFRERQAEPPAPPPAPQSEEDRAHAIGAYLDGLPKLARVIARTHAPDPLAWIHRIRERVERGTLAPDSYAARLAEDAARIKGLPRA